MATTNVYPTPDKFFWPCPCDCEEWRRGREQPRCGMCLQVARFLALDPMDQAIEIKNLYSAQFVMSSWLATEERKADPVRIPRRTALASAGWPEGH